MTSETPQQESNVGPLLMVIGIFALIAVGAFVLLAANPFVIRAHSSSSGTPESFSFDTTCAADNQHCTLTIANDARSRSNLTVRVADATPTGATFTPTTATISPGASQAIAITFSSPECQGQIIFSATFPNDPPHDMPLNLPLNCATPPAH